MRAKDCKFVSTGTLYEYRCRRCAYVAKNIKVLPLRKNCSALGLGDWVEVQLARRGFTKKWWHDWTAYLSPYEAKPLPPDVECESCEERQRRLNVLGDMLLGR
jgi:hypothetical protein